MTKIKGGTPNGQRNGAILKSVIENRPPIFLFLVILQAKA